MNRSPVPADPLRSLRRSIALLRLLSARPAAGWRLTDLAQASAMHHATVHRLVNGLVQERLAMQVPGTLRYALGPMAYELGLAAREPFDVPPPVHERLRSLATRTRDIVFLSVRSGADSVCVGRWEGRSALKAYTVDVGTRRPLSVSAGGVAMLVALPSAQRDAVLRANLDDTVRWGSARVAAVRRMYARSLRLGYGLNQEDIIPGIAAIGVAFGPAAKRPAAAISIAARAADLAGARRDRLAELLSREAAALAAMLAGSRFFAAAAAVEASSKRLD